MKKLCKLSLKIKAFSLVEVAISVSIIVTGLLLLIALLPAGILNVRDSAERYAAVSLSEKIISDLRSTPVSGKSVIYQISIPSPTSTLPETTTVFVNKSGEPVSDPSEARFRINVTVAPLAADSFESRPVHIRATWPASLPLTSNPSSVEVFTALMR